MRILADGNIGFGLAAPVNPLHISRTSGTVYTQYSTTALGNLATDGTLMGIDTTGNAVINN
jgi:hypothetical protein